MRALLAACALLSGCGWTRCDTDRDCLVVCRCASGRDLFVEHTCSVGSCGGRHARDRDCTVPCGASGVLPEPDGDDSAGLDDDSASDDDSGQGR